MSVKLNQGYFASFVLFLSILTLKMILKNDQLKTSNLLLFGKQLPYWPGDWFEVLRPEF